MQKSRQQLPLTASEIGACSPLLMQLCCQRLGRVLCRFLLCFLFLPEKLHAHIIDEADKSNADILESVFLKKA